jgi:hypothetical protein
MSRLSRTEAAVRERWSAWFRYFRAHLYRAHGKTDVELAKDLRVSKGFVSHVIAREREVGFDVALKMLLAFRKYMPDLTLDTLAFQDPPKEPPKEPPNGGHRRKVSG